MKTKYTYKEELRGLLSWLKISQFFFQLKALSGLLTFDLFNLIIFAIFRISLFVKNVCPFNSFIIYISGQSDIKRLRKENDHLRREIWSLRDEYDRLNKRFKNKFIEAEQAARCSQGGCSCQCIEGGCDMVHSKCNSEVRRNPTPPPFFWES